MPGFEFTKTPDNQESAIRPFILKRNSYTALGIPALVTASTDVDDAIADLVTAIKGVTYEGAEIGACDKPIKIGLKKGKRELNENQFSKAANSEIVLVNVTDVNITEAAAKEGIYVDMAFIDVPNGTLHYLQNVKFNYELNIEGGKFPEIKITIEEDVLNASNLYKVLSLKKAA